MSSAEPGSSSVVTPEGDVLVFTCPRCAAPVRARLYGPCDECRVQLRATVGGDARQVDVAEYEPKMNVTPNAVALKDD